MCRPMSRVSMVALLVASLALMPADADARPTQGPALPRVAALLGRDAPLRIVAFGSSSTEGVGASVPSATYPRRLQAWLGAALPDRVEVLNAGVGGNDAEDMARRLPGVLAMRPDLVVWQTGSNDPLRGVPLARFVELTRAGIQAMRNAGIDVMLMEPQDCAVLREHPGAFAYRDALRALAAEMHVPLVRRYDLMHAWIAAGLLTPKQMLLGDGLHMTDGGYALLAQEVGREILALTGGKPSRVGGPDRSGQPK